MIDDPYPEVLTQVIAAHLRCDLVDAERLLYEICYAPVPPKTIAWPSIGAIAAIYRRGCYHCRYCGEKVILTQVMRLIPRLSPALFPYHSNWKSDSTHPAISTRSATLDHVAPVARGGNPVAPENLATAPGTTTVFTSSRAAQVDRSATTVWGVAVLATTVWGVAVLATNSQATGTATLLDVDAIAVDVDSQGISLAWNPVSGFARNEVVARIEGRFGISVYQPLDVVEIAFTV